MPAPVFYGIISNFCNDYNIKQMKEILQANGTKPTGDLLLKSKSSHVPMGTILYLLIIPSFLITLLIRRKLKELKKREEA